MKDGNTLEAILLFKNWNYIPRWMQPGEASNVRGWYAFILVEKAGHGPEFNVNCESQLGYLYYTDPLNLGIDFSEVHMGKNEYYVAQHFEPYIANNLPQINHIYIKTSGSDIYVASLRAINPSELFGEKSQDNKRKRHIEGPHTRPKFVRQS